MANNLRYKFASKSVSYATSTAATGGDITLSGMIGMSAGNLAASKMFGNFNYDASSSRLSNTASEILHTSASGAFSSHSRSGSE